MVPLRANIYYNKKISEEKACKSSLEEPGGAPKSHTLWNHRKHFLV